MKRRALPAVVSVLVGALSCAGVAAQIGSAASPNGRNEILLFDEPVLSYSVVVDGVERIAASPIGMVFTNAGVRAIGGTGCRVAGVERRTLSGTVSTPIYKKSSVSLAANETFVRFDGDWGVRLTARDDGVAYRIETSFGDGKVRVVDETADVEFAPSCKKVLVSNARSSFKGDPFQNSGESIPEFVTPEQILSGKTAKGQVFLPLVAECADGRVVAIAESDVLDFPGLQFARRRGTSASGLAGVHQPVAEKTRFAGWGEENDILSIRSVSYRGYIAETDATRTYPWRVFVVADTMAKLPENDAIYALATPCRLKDVSWIRPGKVAWDWWSLVNLTGVDFRAGYNDRTYEYFIDFAAEFGLEYAILDLGWSKAYDPMKPVVDVPHLVSYAKAKGVGLIVWAPRARLVGRVREVFAHYAKLGVKGFKVDALDGNDQALENFLVEMAETAAELKLVLDFHGVHKPTGLCRTYPNVLNYEGVYGLENCKFVAGYDNAWNDLAVTYVRMTAGGMDYTPGGFRNETWDGFRQVYERPSCRSTRVHQMALCTHFEAPLLMPCDSPSLYRRERECFAFIAKAPTVWDETVGVAGGCSEGYSAIARRKGNMWHLSVIGDRKGGEYEIPLDFLREGRWHAEIFADGVNADRDATDWTRRETELQAGGKLKVKLAPSGGCACLLQCL